MNTDLLLAAAAAIDFEPESFDLGSWGKTSDTTLCGSVGCVAGQVAALVDQKTWIKFINNDSGVDGNPYHPKHPRQVAMKALGLDDVEAGALFMDSTWWARAIKELELDDLYLHTEPGEEVRVEDVSLDCISPKQASEVLRALARGEVALPTKRTNPEGLPAINGAAEGCGCAGCQQLRSEAGEEES